MTTSHLPSCRCKGTGVLTWEEPQPATGTGQDRTYTVAIDCPAPNPTPDQRRAWRAGQVAADLAATTNGGVLNRHTAPRHIARARAALNAATKEA